MKDKPVTNLRRGAKKIPTDLQESCVFRFRTKRSSKMRGSSKLGSFNGNLIVDVIVLFLGGGQLV